MQSNLAKLVLWVVGTLFILSRGWAADTFTESKASDFDLGQQLVTCAAFYDFAAELTAGMNKPSAVEHFRNLSNGWSLAGMLLLSSGATQPRFDAKQTADSIRGVGLTALRAKFEMGGADGLKDLQAEHKRDCDPLIPMQENIIKVMRQGTAAPAPHKK